VAIGIGYGIYRGGVRLNLGRFFTATGLVLVLVAAGLVMTTAHTAHEAGWLNVGQAEAIDLSWLVSPGTVLESLLTGVLGLRAHPTVIEVAVWLAYAIPMLLYVGWPRGRRPRPVRATAPEAAGQPVAGA
jgi:high-affinity iron transporter